MRRKTYPGSEISVEETLAPGANYDRYIASYLSDGYKIYALLTVPRSPKPEGGWPVIVFNHGYIPPAQYRTRWQWLPEMLETYGAPEENPSFYASISPNDHLDDLSGPIQLHHGTADHSVPVEYSKALHEQIQSVGKPVQLFVYQGDNHNISANFARAMTRSVRFFDTYVKGEQQP